MEQTNKLKGGLSDNMTLEDIAKKHNLNVNVIKKYAEKGIKFELEHTDDRKIAMEIVMDHLVEDPRYYIKLRKSGLEEMDSSCSGSFEGPAFGNTPMIKRKINTINNSVNEELGSSVSAGAIYDVSFSGGPKHKNPLKIDGVKSIGQRASYMNKKKIPKWGGPGGIFIKIKDKCKKFPYCNQGDINAIEILHECIIETSKKYDLPQHIVEEIVIKEINRIFI